VTYHPTLRGVVFVMDPPQPCATCGEPSGWFAKGIEGCPHRCGAFSDAAFEEAKTAVSDYLASFDEVSAERARYAARHPVIPARPGRPRRATAPPPPRALSPAVRSLLARAAR